MRESGMKNSKLFTHKKILSILLAAALLLSPAAPCGGTLNVGAKEEVKKTVELVVAKPVITDVSNEYKGLLVSWKQADNALGYYVFRRQKSSAPWELQADLPGDTLSYLDKDAMKEGGIYTYMLKGYNGEILSEESAPKTATRFPVSRVGINIKYAQKSARNMQKMINDFRTGKDTWLWNETNTKQVYTYDLNKLAYDYKLEKIAMLRAAEIALKFNHERPNGRMCFSALDESDYNYTYAGENIAYGYKTAKAAFEAFQEVNEKYAGQGHRRNMLNPNYNVCAIGHAKVKGVHYWVQLFANTTDDSDYTKTVSTTKKVNMYISTDDLSSYKKTLKSLGAKISDYAPQKTSFVAIAGFKGKVVMAYNKAIGATGYEIYRSDKKKGGFKKVGTITSQLKLEYTDRKVSRKKKYYYYIVPYRVAHDERIYGKKSETKEVKTK